jgi:hypothetical protein
MDTEIGNPIEYNPQVTTDEPEREEQQYFYPPHMMTPRPPHEQTKQDIFAHLDKTAYLVIFAAFILGFFMGKTMQPVILRHG